MSDTTAATIARKKKVEQDRIERIKNALEQIPDNLKQNYLGLVNEPKEKEEELEKVYESEEEVPPPNQPEPTENIFKRYEEFMKKNPTFQRTLFTPIIQHNDKPTEEELPEKQHEILPTKNTENVDKPKVELETENTEVKAGVPSNDTSILRLLSTTGIQIVGAIIIFFITAATKSIARTPRTQEPIPQTHEKLIYLDRTDSSNSFMFMK